LHRSVNARLERKKARSPAASPVFFPAREMMPAGVNRYIVWRVEGGFGGFGLGMAAGVGEAVTL
jgi:hypothetical protein